jgi:photosystem II stability/assembly factor-like uncharacterized protein
MKLLLLSLLFCNIAYSQWSSVITFDASSKIQAINAFDFVNEQNGFLISPYNHPSGSTNTFYRTIDGGITWDSLTTVEGDFKCIVMVTDSIIYAAGNLLMNPGTTNAYLSKQLYRSLDAGQTWSQHEIFNTIGYLERKCMVFTNDSTGFVSCSNGLYYTNNYGTNWSLLNTTSGKFLVNLGSEVGSFYNNDVYLTNTTSLNSQTNILDCYGIGGVEFASSYGDTLIRTNHCNDGLGNILFALTISELGGNTKVLHFFNDGIYDVAINPSGIFANSGRPLRSIDGGQSFFKQDCTLPSDSVLVFLKLDFVDNNTAYALALHYDSSFFKLMKTTNAGGITTNYVTQPLQNVGLTNDLDGFSLEVYPNPAINELNIESSSLIDQLEIYDLTGRSLAKYTGIQSTHFEVDCRFLLLGNYLVKVSSEGKTVVRQVRVE